MRIGHLSPAELPLTLWFVETLIGFSLIYVAHTYSVLTLPILIIVSGFILTQFSALPVWIMGISPFGRRLTHMFQAIVRLCFYITIFGVLAWFSPLFVKLSLVVVIPVSILIAYTTDFVWYEMTIAP